MNKRGHFLPAAGLLGLLALAQFAMHASYAQAPTLSGGQPKITPPPGGVIFREACASCHTDKGLNVDGRVIASRDSLGEYAPEVIYRALASGKMRAQGEALSETQKRQVAVFLARRPFLDAGTEVKSMPKGRCARSADLQQDAAQWNGWGNANDNARFQSTQAAGLTARDVPKLKLKWAFGVPGATNMYSQPTLAWGRVFFGSDNAAVYSIAAESGCAYWSFHADAPVRSAPIAIHIPQGSANVAAVVFTTTIGTAYAVDAKLGTQLWKALSPGRIGTATGSPAYHDGRLYIPFTGGETVIGSDPNYECCKSRGSIVARDVRDGRLLWRSETIPQALTRVGTNERGTALWGPSGASVWNAPTIDAKRGLLYVGTGNSFGPVAADTSDSILAMRLDTGAIVWHHQEFAGDAFMLGCKNVSPRGGNCPEKLGPDWDFGGSSAVLRTLPNGRDVLLAAGKGGIAIALDPSDGRVIWRTTLYEGAPPTADGLVLFGGAADENRIYYPLQQPGGGVLALDIATGRKLWTAKLDTDPRGQIGAASAIPGVVFTGGWDGVLRAVGSDGQQIWSFQTRQTYTTVNGIEARGGSLGSPGPTIAGGRLFVASGYVGMQGGAGGNVLLAFAP